VRATKKKPEGMYLLTFTSWESPRRDPTNTTPLSRYVRHSAIEVWKKVGT
jgi:hypothetical protein